MRETIRCLTQSVNNVLASLEIRLQLLQKRLHENIFVLITAYALLHDDKLICNTSHQSYIFLISEGIKETFIIILKGKG